MRAKEGMYIGMLSHEIEAAKEIERCIVGTIGCHFSSECIEHLIDMLLPMEIVKRKP